MDDFRILDPNLKIGLDYLSDGISRYVDLGLKLFEADIQAKDKTDSHITAFMFLRNFIETLDAISILIKKSACTPCYTLLRTGLENQVSIEYVLETDTERRSLAFIVCDTIEKMKSATLLDGKSSQYQDLNSTYQKDKMVKGIYPPIRTDAEEIIKNGEYLLNSPKYAPIYEEYQRCKTEYKKRNKTFYWYTLFDGPNSVRGLFDHIHLNAHYIFYKLHSKHTHGNEILNGKIYSTNEILHIRDPLNAQQIARHVCNMANYTFLLYIQRRMPEKELELQEDLAWLYDFTKDIGSRQLFDFRLD